MSFKDLGNGDGRRGPREDVDGAEQRMIKRPPLRGAGPTASPEVHFQGSGQRGGAGSGGGGWDGCSVVKREVRASARRGCRLGTRGRGPVR